MEIDIYQVDSFTTQAFKGNPAGVCLCEDELSEEHMLAIAQEMAVSETAFLALKTMRLRWFTPKVEVALCGHGTLAVVQVLLHTQSVKIGDELRFQTLSGELVVQIENNHIGMNFPMPNMQAISDVDTQLLGYLGLATQEIQAVQAFDNKLLIVVDDEQRVVDLAPNFAGLAQLNGRGVVVTAASSSDKQDFISRYFAPWVGVNEDPVTGSAHCALAHYWCQRLQKEKLTGYQASERGGYVGVERLSGHRVKLTGQAKLMLAGKMYI